MHCNSCSSPTPQHSSHTSGKTAMATTPTSCTSCSSCTSPSRLWAPPCHSHVERCPHAGPHGSCSPPRDDQDCGHRVGRGCVGQWNEVLLESLYTSNHMGGTPRGAGCSTTQKGSGGWCWGVEGGVGGCWCWYRLYSYVYVLVDRVKHGGSFGSKANKNPPKGKHLTICMYKCTHPWYPPPTTHHSVYSQHEKQRYWHE